MIVVCSYCKRQRINDTWIDSTPIHGICDSCYKREMLAAGFTMEEIDEDLNSENEKDKVK
jgi:hypothetical protein